MSTTTKLRYDEYEAMIERGEFPADDPRRFELIEGDLVEMTASNPAHEWTIDVLAEWSVENLPRRSAWVRVQQSVAIPAIESVPIPDLSWVRRGDFRSQRPQASDILLIVEVSETTLSYDRNAKAHIYARAGLADYWIVNLKGECFEVLRDPTPSGYETRTLVYPGETIRPIKYPDLEFPVSLIFPESS